MDGLTYAILGAGGHARAVISVIEHSGHTISCVLDDTYDPPNQEYIAGHLLSGRLADLPPHIPVILGVGDNGARENLFNAIAPDRLATLVAPTSFVASTVKLRRAVQIMPQAVVGAEAEICDNSLINSGAIVEHESYIGQHCHVSINATIAGRVRVGARCFIGAGATVIEGVTIADRVIVGAGAVVVRDITTPGTYVGVPVRRIG